MLVFRNTRLLKNIASFSTHPQNILHILKGNSYNMNKAYFRHIDGEDSYNLTFIFSDPSLNVTRQFNFSRQSAENVGTLLGRITTNVEKVLTKKKVKKNKKVDKDLVVEAVPVEVKLVLNGEEVSKEIICVDALKEKETELCVVDRTYQIVINAPTVTILTLPSSILAGFPVYPNKFEGFFLNSKCSEFQWYSAIVGEKTDPTKAEWKKVGEGFTYFTGTDDIGKRLRIVCMPGDGIQFGPEVEAFSTSCVEAGPGVCPFESRHGFTRDLLSGKGFRVVSYNILADLYCDSDFTRTVLHPYCPPYALNYDYRKQLIFKEILGYHGDIYCMQEVDCKVFDHELTPLLKEHSYQGVFSKKGALVAEGLACYFRTERFKLVDSLSCVLGEEVKTSPVLESIWTRICENEAFVKRLCDRASTTQAVILQSLDNEDEIIVVGNTHLYFHPDADHVRLTQGGITILWLENIVEETKKKLPGKRISLVLCGDFNSTPSCGIYQLYTTGVAPCDLIDWKSNEAEMVTDLTLTQSLPLSSACGTPEFTNYTAEFADCLDYIFHDKENLAVTQIVPLPSVEELTQHTALPSIVFPSDHIALIADLEFK